MRIDFMFDNIKNQLENAASRNDYIALNDARRIIESWELAYDKDNKLKPKYEELLYFLDEKQSLSLDEAKYAMRLVMKLHEPLIQHKNDVLAIRVRDEQLNTLINKIR